jgi:hypothetical protein
MVLLVLILMTTQYLMRDSTDAHVKALFPHNGSSSSSSNNNKDKDTNHAQQATAAVQYPPVAHISLQEANRVLEVRDAILTLTHSMTRESRNQVFETFPAIAERDSCFEIDALAWSESINPQRNQLAQVFYDMTAALEKQGIAAWLTEGTLLNSLRSGFAIYDNDIDLDLLMVDGEDAWYTKRKSLAAALHEIGFKCWGSSVVNMYRHLLFCRKHGTQVRVDLHAYFPLSNTTLYNSYIGEVQRNVMLPPVSCMFFNQRYRCPAQSLRVLLNYRNGEYVDETQPCLLIPPWIQQSQSDVQENGAFNTSFLQGLSATQLAVEREVMSMEFIVATTIKLEQCGYPSFVPLLESYLQSHNTTCTRRLPGHGRYQLRPTS